MDPHDVLHFDSPAAFGAWLAEHHDSRDEQWVGYWKKATGLPSLTWEESVDEALRFGWIDGIRQRLDDEAYTIRFTPRRRGSNWSLRNIERYSVLLGEGRIEPSGAAAYAKRTEEKSGTYSFERKKALELSPEFTTRLKADGAAWKDWQGRPQGYRRKVTHWIMSAKRPATRERRLATLIEECARASKVKPFR